MMRSERSWCALCRYPGKEAFYLGSVVVRADAPTHEVEEAMSSLMDDLFPIRPMLINLLPGSITFTPE